jgi:hypothetical protein
MRENIDKILARGEKLDALPPPDFGNLTSTSKAFNDAARRVRRRKDIWNRAYDEVVRLGSQGVDILQGLSGSIIETRSRLFAEAGKKMTTGDAPENIPDTLRDEHGREDDVSNEFEAEFEGKNVVDKLLSEWTNLPSQHSSDTKQVERTVR